MTMKRIREDVDDITIMANYLILLSHGQKQGGGGGGGEFLNRVFECKTCNRQFPSFQALGGHRASHKKPKLVAGSDQLLSSRPKPKSHECSICGLEFAIGQALGGHMRRHRAATINEQNMEHHLLSPAKAPIVKKSNSRRVLSLDLNLTPSENYKFLFGKVEF